MIQVNKRGRAVSERAMGLGVSACNGQNFPTFEGTRSRSSLRQLACRKLRVQGAKRRGRERPLGRRRSSASYPSGAKEGGAGVGVGNFHCVYCGLLGACALPEERPSRRGHRRCSPQWEGASPVGARLVWYGECGVVGPGRGYSRTLSGTPDGERLPPLATEVGEVVRVGPGNCP